MSSALALAVPSFTEDSTSLATVPSQVCGVQRTRGHRATSVFTSSNGRTAHLATEGESARLPAMLGIHSRRAATLLVDQLWRRFQLTLSTWSVDSPTWFLQTGVESRWTGVSIRGATACVVAVFIDGRLQNVRLCGLVKIVTVKLGLGKHGL